MKKKRILILLSSCLFFQLFGISQTATLAQKIVPPKRETGDNFGWSSAISKTHLVIGVPIKKSKLSFFQEAGAAYLYINKNGKWIYLQELEREKPKAFDFFGSAVAISETYIAISAYGEDDDEVNPSPLLRKGAVYLYKTGKDLKHSSYVQKIRLKERHKDDCFGYSLAISDSLLLVGAPGELNRKTGKPEGILNFYKLQTNGKWKFSAEIAPPVIGCSRFGKSVSLYQKTCIVSDDSSGAVYVYEYNNQFWEYKTALKATDKTDRTFGNTLYIFKNILTIGAPGEYNFNEDQTEDLQLRKHISGGSVYIYYKESDQWHLKTKLIPEDVEVEMHFGNAIAVDNNKVIIGAFGDKVNKNTNTGDYSGAVYVYDINDSIVVRSQKITSPIRNAWDKFGFSVCISGETIVIGSRFDKTDNNFKNPIEGAGAAYIYELK